MNPANAAALSLVGWYSNRVWSSMSRCSRPHARVRSTSLAPLDGMGIQAQRRALPQSGQLDSWHRLGFFRLPTPKGLQHAPFIQAGCCTLRLSKPPFFT